MSVTLDAVLRLYLMGRAERCGHVTCGRSALLRNDCSMPNERGAFT